MLPQRPVAAVLRAGNTPSGDAQQALPFIYLAWEELSSVGSQTVWWRCTLSRYLAAPMHLSVCMQPAAGSATSLSRRALRDGKQPTGATTSLVAR